MIQTEYINSYNRNYVKIPVYTKGEEKLRYQYQIITTRKLEGMLPVRMFHTNEEQSLYYDITSLQNVATLFTKRKINKEWLDSFTAHLKATLWSLEQYLLDERNLIFQADYIFQDIESGRISFMYIPYYIEEQEMDMETFLDFLVQYVDQEEPETVEAVFHIYTKWESMKSRFTINTFLLLWEKNNTAAECSEIVAEEETYDENILPLDLKDDYDQSKKWDISGILLGRGRLMKTEEYRMNPSLVNEEEEFRQNADEYRLVTEYMEITEPREERKLFGNGKQNRKVICLEKLPIIIGKKGGITDVVLKDNTISRMHARLTESDGHIYLEDLNTTNGTFQNGVRLKPYEKVEVQREDEIRMGNLSFTYR